MIAIANTYPASKEAWDKIWHECSYATYFHSREWIEIWRRFTQDQTQAEPKIIQFSDQKTALLPFAFRQRAKGLMNTYTSAMEGTFGGWISSDNLRLEHIRLLIDFLLNQLKGNLSWRINPYDDLLSKIPIQAEHNCCLINPEDPNSTKAISALLELGHPIFILDETQTLNLDDGFNSLFKSQSSSVRKAKKASKAGVSIKVIQTPEEWREYYQVYQASLERWHSSSGYAWELFEVMQQLNSPNIKLWVAVYDNQIVCGALCFYSKHHVVYWHGCALEQYFELRPVNLMMLEIIRNSCEQGYSWFDFNPSGGMKGVKAFKASFGAKAVPCPQIYVDTPIKRLARSYLLAKQGSF
ncbi:GNAT family N-acetyltransferase [Pantanalinema sp. GBBB05]|uniref:GNAT family N-acetyltransferase n=1 Tax=Pantanalinema sp. GBBB05 TaxID=2604139 RepID=UPI001DBA8830|nr:GNAT family N-acetyltransferase [Pantanalinema sp. GBBB05]